jgi:hypothetical protein
MAMTHMQTGICTAGFIADKDAPGGVRWVRPVKSFGSLLPGDMTDAAGRLVQMDDVAQLHLIKPAPEHPHVEDWETDFIKHRPAVMRRLEGDKRADFLRNHVDNQPLDVLQHRARSLCLIRPDSLWARFTYDAAQGCKARIGFTLDGVIYPTHNPGNGASVTDLRWRALGRRWLAADKQVQQMTLAQSALLDRLEASEIFLSIGLSRTFEGKIWLLVIGVHIIPDYHDVAIDLNNL